MSDDLDKKLWSAASKGEVNLLNELLGDKANPKYDVNQVFQNGKTLLFEGLEHEEVVKNLLERGANPSIEVKKGNSLTDYANAFGWNKSADLIQSAIGANRRDKEVMVAVSTTASDELPTQKDVAVLDDGTPKEPENITTKKSAMPKSVNWRTMSSADNMRKGFEHVAEPAINHILRQNINNKSTNNHSR